MTATLEQFEQFHLAVGLQKAAMAAAKAARAAKKAIKTVRTPPPK